MATFKGLHLRFQSVVDRNVLMCCLHRFLNPHRLLVETWCFTPSSKVNLLFVSPFVQLKSLILLLVLCPKRRDSQLTNRSQGGRLIISCDKVRFFWRSENVGDWTMWFKTNSKCWPDLIQVIEHLFEFKSYDLIWYMAFVLIERYFSIFLVLNRQPPTISRLLVFINPGLTSHMETAKKILVHGYGWWTSSWFNLSMENIYDIHEWNRYLLLFLGVYWIPTIRSKK